jgi:SOS-response transcriptional repressor LexA
MSSCISLVYDRPSIKIFAICALSYTIVPVADTKPIPVRLDEEVISRLAATAKRMGTNRAALIRFLTQSFLDHFEKNGGTASLPHDWREILRLQDGRAFGQVRGRASATPKPKRKSGNLRDIADVSLPVYGNLPAGWPQSRDGVSRQEPDRIIRVKRGAYPAGAFGLDVRGHSMNNAKPDPILDGDVVVLVSPEEREPRNGDIVAALIDGETCLKRLVNGGEPAHLRSESTNPRYGAIHPKQQLIIQGVLVGLIKGE